MNLGAPELIIVFLIILLVFGGTKLPKLARSLGQAQKEFKTGMNEAGTSDVAAPAAAPAPPQVPAASTDAVPPVTPAATPAATPAPTPPVAPPPSADASDN